MNSRSLRIEDFAAGPRSVDCSIPRSVPLNDYTMLDLLEDRALPLTAHNALPLSPNDQTERSARRTQLRHRHRHACRHHAAPARRRLRPGRPAQRRLSQFRVRARRQPRGGVLLYLGRPARVQRPRSAAHAGVDRRRLSAGRQAPQQMRMAFSPEDIRPRIASTSWRR